MNKKIPLTILTGFLGAGKTTLLNRIIKENTETQFAIIENEVGQISIDSDLVIGIDDNNLFELANGCICCTSNAEFGIVLNRIIKEKEHLDHILIETTGIANPASVIESILGDSFISQKVKINSIISLVDAAANLNQLDDTLEARQQVILSDTHYVSKSDLVGKDKLEQVKHKIHKMNPAANVLVANNNVHTSLLLKLDAYEEKQAKTSVLNYANFIPVNQPLLAHEIKTCAIVKKGTLNANSFPFWLWNFLQLNHKECLRIKGTFSYTGVNQPMLLQGVGSAHTISPIIYDNEDANTVRLVFIVKNMDTQDIITAIEKMIE